MTVQSTGERIHAVIVRALLSSLETHMTVSEAEALASNIIMMLAANGFSIGGPHGR